MSENVVAYMLFFSNWIFKIILIYCFRDLLEGSLLWLLIKCVFLHALACTLWTIFSSEACSEELRYLGFLVLHGNTSPCPMMGERFLSTGRQFLISSIRKEHLGNWTEDLISIVWNKITLEKCMLTLFYIYKKNLWICFFTPFFQD